MKSKIILCLALVAFNLSSHARAVRPWSGAELMEASDLVVVGQPIKVKDLDETNSLGWSQSESFRPKFRGIETTFKVSDVLKGMSVSDKVVLHHYRVELEWGSPPNGPDFVSFPANSTNTYLLYLINDGTNRFAPAAGQIDPRLSIKPAPDLFKLECEVVCEAVTNAINREDWDALRKLAKPGMKANEFITRWENDAKTGHAVRVGKLVTEAKNSTIYLDGEPCAKYSYTLENKDGTPNPHWLQIMVREEGGKTVLLDFWNFGW